MSVLVEAVTLVVRRPSLDLAYPGGVEAFLRATRKLANPPRFACDADPLLVNISFEHPDHVASAVELLEANGLVGVEDDEAGDFVYVDQRTGPITPCSWLTWERFTEGVTVAWMVGREPGALAAPKDWSPSETAEPGDEERESAGRFLALGVHDGSEIMLDLDTGAEIARPAPPRLELSIEPEDRMPLHTALTRALAELGWHTYFDEPPAVMTDLRGVHAIYTSRYLAAEEAHALVCCTRAPLVIPQPARRKAMEFITRANYGMLIGAFEMSLDQGTLYFRVTCPLEDGVLTTEMVSTLANAGVWAFDRYYPHLCGVVYGKRSAAEAVRAAES